MLGKVVVLVKDKANSSVLLLVSCLIFIFLLPVFEFPTPAISIILFSIILFLAAYSISRKAILIGIVAILIELATRASDFIYLNYLAVIITNLFIIFIFIITPVLLDQSSPKEDILADRDAKLFSSSQVKPALPVAVGTNR